MTGVLRIGIQKVDLHIRMEGKYINQVHDYVSLYAIHNTMNLWGGAGGVQHRGEPV